MDSANDLTEVTVPRSSCWENNRFRWLSQRGNQAVWCTWNWWFSNQDRCVAEKWKVEGKSIV